MAGDQVFELFNHSPAPCIGAITVYHRTERIYRLVIHQNAHLHQIVLLIADHLIVKRGIALGHGLQPVIEIKHHLIERQVIDHHSAGSRIGQIHLHAATVLAQLQHITKILIRHQNRGLDPRLFKVIDQCQIRHICGVVQLLDPSVAHVDVIDH